MRHAWVELGSMGSMVGGEAEDVSGDQLCGTSQACVGTQVQRKVAEMVWWWHQPSHCVSVAMYPSHKVLMLGILPPRPQLVQCSEAPRCCPVHVAYVPMCLRAIRKGRERGSTGLWSSCRDPLYFSPVGQKLVTWLARSWSCCHTSMDVGKRGLPSGQPCSQTLKSRALLLLRKHELMLREELFVSGPI